MFGIKNNCESKYPKIYKSTSSLKKIAFYTVVKYQRTFFPDKDITCHLLMFEDDRLLVRTVRLGLN